MRLLPKNVKLGVMTTLVCILSAFTSAYAESDIEVLPEYVFSPVASPIDKVTSALADARHDNKTLLVVLGAQWCHDSRGLSSAFSTPEMQHILSENYTVSFIDVGYLEDRRDVTQLFNYPTYFATPTVIVVDPKTGLHLNQSTMPKWAFAASVPLEDYVSYFERFITLNKSQASVRDTQLSPQIDAFGRQQAARLQQGYEQLGPMLEQDEQGASPAGLNELWKEVRSYRMAVQEQLADYASSTHRDNEVSLPHYSLMSWEQPPNT